MKIEWHFGSDFEFFLFTKSYIYAQCAAIRVRSLHSSVVCASTSDVLSKNTHTVHWLLKLTERFWIRFVCHCVQSNYIAKDSEKRQENKINKLFYWLVISTQSTWNYLKLPNENNIIDSTFFFRVFISFVSSFAFRFILILDFHLRNRTNRNETWDTNKINVRTTI